MREIGLFPLGAVLLPTERVPLHIFEPRYRELITECIESAADFGVVLADDDGLRDIGTAARVVEVTERFEDGRLNVVVEGGERFRIVRLTAGRSFQTGDVEPFPDENGQVEQQAVERALGLLRRVAELEGVDADSARQPTGREPSFELAAQIELDPGVKQRLLELRSEPERLRELARTLAEAATAIERARHVRVVAARNGHPRRGAH